MHGPFYEPSHGGRAGDSMIAVEIPISVFFQGKWVESSVELEVNAQTPEDAAYEVGKAVQAAISLAKRDA